MSADGAYRTGDQAPLALVAVEPQLLASTLTRLLSARGWRVDDLRRSIESRGPVDAVLVSRDPAGDLPPVEAKVVLVVDGAEGAGGFVCHIDGREEPLREGAESLEALFAFLPGVPAGEGPQIGLRSAVHVPPMP